MNHDSPDKGTRESKIWGSTESPGKVYISIPEQPGVKMRYSNNDFEFGRFGPENYALFSLKQNGNDIARENFAFTLNIRYPDEYHDDVRLALSAWIYFGGIGARTRRGCGSLSCDGDIMTLGEIMKNAPHITLWRKRANDSLSAWSYAVKKYRDYRQKRNPGQGNRPGRSKWPEADSLRKMTGKYPEKHSPREYLPLPSFPRAALGMPIIFQFPSDRRHEPDGIQLIPDVKDSSRMASPVITKALCDNGTWYSAVIILPHDDILRTKLKLSTPLRLRDAEKIIPLKSEKYIKLETMPGQSDAISGFEEFISGDFTKEGTK